MSKKLVAGMLVALVRVAAAVAFSSVVSAQEPQPPQGTCPMLADGAEFPEEGCPRYAQGDQEGACPMGGTCEGRYDGCEAFAGSGDFEGCGGMGRHIWMEGGCPMGSWGD
jgi:hypothetical protein